MLRQLVLVFGNLVLNLVVGITLRLSDWEALRLFALGNLNFFLQWLAISAILNGAGFSVWLCIRKRERDRKLQEEKELERAKKEREVYKRKERLVRRIATEALEKFNPAMGVVSSHRAAWEGEKRELLRILKENGVAPPYLSTNDVKGMWKWIAEMEPVIRHRGLRVAQSVLSDELSQEIREADD